jgi:hypothetical protein
MREIKKIVVHVTDSDDSLDIGVREIRKWHTDAPPKGNGWSDIGYHYVIRRNGVVERGRSDDQMGAHVMGHNQDSIGICWVGRNQISEKQVESLKAILRGLCHQYGLDVTEDVYGHYELDSRKTCPNLDMDLLRAELLFQ